MLMLIGKLVVGQGSAKLGIVRVHPTHGPDVIAERRRRRRIEQRRQRRRRFRPEVRIDIHDADVRIAHQVADISDEGLGQFALGVVRILRLRLGRARGIECRLDRRHIDICRGKDHRGSRSTAARSTAAAHRPRWVPARAGSSPGCDRSRRCSGRQPPAGPRRPVGRQPQAPPKGRQPAPPPRRSLRSSEKSAPASGRCTRHAIISRVLQSNFPPKTRLDGVRF